MNALTIARADYQATTVGTPIAKNEIGSCPVERMIRAAVEATIGRNAPTLQAEQFRSFRALDVVFPEQRGIKRKKWTPVLRFIVTPNKLHGVQVLMESGEESFATRIRNPSLACLTLRAAVRDAGIKQDTIGDAMQAFIDLVNQ